MGLVNQRVNMSSEPIELFFNQNLGKKKDKNKRKIQPVKLKTRKGGSDKNQGKPTKLKT